MKYVLSIFLAFLVSFTFTSCQNQDLKTLKKGDKIPNFELRNEDNELVDISDYVGLNNLVIYFYPKDDSPGCTKEACKFRDEYEVFLDFEAKVVGISNDSPEAHKAFKEKYNLPFTLLSDPEDAVSELFGVKGELMGVIPGRVTFVVDKKGVIVHVFDSMSDAEQHVIEAKEVLMGLHKK